MQGGALPARAVRLSRARRSPFGFPVGGNTAVCAAALRGRLPDRLSGWAGDVNRIVESRLLALIRALGLERVGPSRVDTQRWRAERSRWSGEFPAMRPPVLVHRVFPGLRAVVPPPVRRPIGGPERPSS